MVPAERRGKGVRRRVAGPGGDLGEGQLAGPQARWPTTLPLAHSLLSATLDSVAACYLSSRPTRHLTSHRPLRTLTLAYVYFLRLRSRGMPKARACVVVDGRLHFCGRTRRSG